MRKLLVLLPLLGALAATGACAAPLANGATMPGFSPPVSGAVKPYKVEGSFTNRLDAVFGDSRPGATVHDKAELDRIAYYRYIYGDATTTGNGTDGLYGNYRSHHRDYPGGDPRSLHVFSADALTLKAHCGLDTGIRSDCATIESGIMRFALPIRPGSYLEIRCKMPTGMYAWPAFWLNPGVEYPARPGEKQLFSALHWPPEIDIFDEFGFNNTPPGHYLVNGAPTGNNDAAYGNPHDVYRDPNWGDKWYFQTSEDLTAAYHIYGLDWGGDNLLKFYLDGRLIRTLYYEWNSVENTPAHLIASLQIGANFNNLSRISDQGGKPNGWDWPIDYIRVWDKMDGPVQH